MEYLIEGMTTDELARIIAGAGIPDEITCPSFVCGTYTDPCYAHCSGVGCSGGFSCDSYSS